jgi:hypothetical protein
MFDYFWVASVFMNVINICFTVVSQDESLRINLQSAHILGLGRIEEKSMGLDLEIQEKSKTSYKLLRVWGKDMPFQNVIDS